MPAMKKYLAWFIPSFVLGATGCPDVNVDPGEGVNDTTPSGPVAEFDPANKVIPFPNNLVLDPATGKVNLPRQCNEGALAQATRENVLNKLDGFGTYETAMQITFSEPVDEASLAGHVVLYKRASGATAVDPASATAVPLKLIKGTTVRYADQSMLETNGTCSGPQMVDALTMIPLVPLDQKSTYVAAVLKGVKTASGAEVGSTFTWSLIRQDKNPVTLDEQGNVISDTTPLSPGIPAQLAQLKGIDLLWKAHAKALAFLSAKHAREDILLAWEFNTQTVTDPLDPSVTGSLAAMAKTQKLGLVHSVTGGATGEQFLQSRLPAGSCTVDGGAIPCNAVGDVIGGLLNATSYQQVMPAKITTTSPNPNEGGPIPGAWNDPIHPTKTDDTPIAVFGMTPCVGAPPCPATEVPAAGWPVIIYGHGLGSSKTTLAGIGAQFAAAGFASVAIDFVAHDSRAVRISTDAALGCNTRLAEGPQPASCPTPDLANENCLRRPVPTSDPQCYAPFLSPDLAVTRDNIRQSVLDVQELVNALEACGTSMCDPLKVDVANISYTGLSLGGILGSTIVATKPDFHSAVLNVPGVGWVDVLENSATNAIKCPLVDALIGAGILTGEKSNLTVTPNTGLCTTDAWKAQPGYQQFSSIARWALDPADPANFTRMLATRRILIQEVVGDAVVPNIATEREAALVGLTAMARAADPAVPPITASMAITDMPRMNKFVRYMNLPPQAPSFPGNTFEHASLLRPAPSSGTGTIGADGRLGTARLQTDAITYLVLNRGN
jgi:dienelactone hydrolase